MNIENAATGAGNSGDSVAQPELDDSARQVRTPHERLLESGALRLGIARDFLDEVAPMVAAAPLFSGLDDDELLRLCDAMAVYQAPVECRLVAEGDPGDFIVLVLSGLIDVLRRNRFNYPARIAVAEPGQVFGEVSMFDGQPRFSSCVALEPTRVAVLTLESLLAIFEADPRLGNKVLQRLAQQLSERLRETSAKLVSVMEAARDG